MSAQILAFLIPLVFARLNASCWVNPRFLHVLQSPEYALELAGRLGFQFCPGFLAALQASAPPTIDWFLALSDAIVKKHWFLYFLVLQKFGCPDLLYGGSGTAFKRGGEERWEDYDNLELLPMYVKKAIDDGYIITRKVCVATCPIPAAVHVPLSRALCLAFEAVFAAYFSAMVKRDHNYGFEHLCPWPSDSFTYLGLCSRSPFKDAIVGDLGLSEEQLQSIADETYAKDIAYGKVYHKQQRVDATPKFKSQQATANKKARPRTQRLKEEAKAAKTFYCAPCDHAAGVFTVLFYEMPVKHNVLTLHSSANEGKNGDVTVFFGLSGTGKTTLSADPKRALIGDDEHCWSDKGVFNIEGGCYAKTIGLSAEKEPDIFNAIKFGSILENVVFDPTTREVDYEDSTLTENTRCAYPIEYIENTKIPCISSGHPTNIILLTCDARGVLPPISKLTPEQTMFHFISGYTSKMAGTEQGVTEPQATFSSCFAQPFLALHPMRYATMLAEKIKEHKANAWLLNTGWVGAGATTGGKRCPLKYTRAILDAIHSGELANNEYETYQTFNLQVPKTCSNVPDEVLNPAKCWTGTADFQGEVKKLGKLFNDNFEKYSSEATEDVIKAGPQI
ncbi:ATP-utilizing phosphoenolpyruvate carboxykinase [Aureobasidium subglaciale]|nr:ATP-utilizing phosphoenolpyruvate carboxykinase [Aureobasidium subglaciale]